MEQRVDARRVAHLGLRQVDGTVGQKEIGKRRARLGVILKVYGLTLQRSGGLRRGVRRNVLRQQRGDQTQAGKQS